MYRVWLQARFRKPFEVVAPNTEDINVSEQFVAQEHASISEP